jgi:hypothetical protein
VNILSTIIIGDVTKPRPAHGSRGVEPANWEHPGERSFCDDLGKVAKSLHMPAQARRTRTTVLQLPEPRRLNQLTMYRFDSAEFRRASNTGA